MPLLPERSTRVAIEARPGGLERLFQERLADGSVSAFERRICGQFLKLQRARKLLEEEREGGSLLSRAIATARAEKGITRKNALSFYRELVVTLYKDPQAQATLFSEIHEVMEKRSSEILQEEEIQRKVAIIGAGGSGLTVARTLLDKGIASEYIIVVEQSDHVGGLFAGNVPTFSLLNPAPLQGPNVFVQPRDLFRFREPDNKEYADAVTLNGYFNGIEVVFNSKAIIEEAAQGKRSITVSPDGKQYAFPIETKSNGKRVIVAEAVVLAQSGMGEAKYGNLSARAHREILQLKQTPLGERVLHAMDFMGKLAGIESKLYSMSSEEVLSGKEELLSMLEQGLAVVGGLKSAELYLNCIAGYLDLLRRVGQFNSDDRKRTLQGGIHMFDSHQGFQYHIREIKRTYPQLASYFEELFKGDNRDWNNRLNFARVTGIAASINPERIVVVSNSIYGNGPQHKKTDVGFVAFTGFSPDTFWQYTNAVRQESREMPVYTETDRYSLNDQGYVKPYRIYMTWPSKFKLPKEDGKQPSRGDIKRDGKRAEILADQIYVDIVGQPVRRGRWMF